MNRTPPSLLIPGSIIDDRVRDLLYIRGAVDRWFTGVYDVVSIK